jgi:hypothetical protein
MMKENISMAKPYRNKRHPAGGVKMASMAKTALNGEKPIINNHEQNSAISISEKRHQR